MGIPLILLSESTAGATPEVRGKTLVVCHKDYAPPRVRLGPVMDFAEFKINCRSAVKGIDSLVFVGLNKAMTPSSRTEDVWELLFNQTPGLHKVSVDRTLFVSEPWRAWFHFGLVGAKYRDYTYSFIAESHYKNHLDGLRKDDPFAPDELLSWSRPVVHCSYRKWFKINTTITRMSATIHAEYAEYKRAVFDEEVTINPILARLAAFADKVFPQRRVPSLRQLFAARRHEIVATDLPIDQWVVGRLKHMADLTNCVAEGCQR